MEFDATFLIAVISFIIFVIIMNKIFYAPVLKIMKERQAFVRNNFEKAALLKKTSEQKLDYINSEMNKSREIAREMISKNSQKLKVDINNELFEYKKNLNENIFNQRNNLKNSAKEAGETLKDNVVDIAKEISQIILGDVIDKDKITKSQIEE